MDGYTENVCKDIELRIDSDPFFTSCKISSINKKAISQNTLEPKAHFKCFLWILLQQKHQKF